MSLHHQAKQLAARGRGPDTLLVHMAPGEVAGLEALARRHYGQGLTTNPDTGLPEAGILSSILPIVAGIALTATGVGAPLAAAMVGGGTALATGSLQQGLMAGLGAFGGAGMGSALSGMGTAAAAAAPSAAAQTAATAVPAAETASAFADPVITGGMETVSPGFEAAGAGAGTPSAAEAAFRGTDAMAEATAPAGTPMSGWDAMSGGIKDLTSPGGFDRFVDAQGGHAGRNAMMAAYPMMGALKKKPLQDDGSSDAMIRPYGYDAGSHTFTPGTPYSAKDAPKRFAVGGSIDALMDSGSDAQNINRYTFDPATQAYALPLPVPPAAAQMQMARAQEAYGGGDGPEGSVGAPEGTPSGTGDTGSDGIGGGGTGDGDGGSGGPAGDSAGASDGGDDFADGGITGLLRGPGDGVSDSIPATINGQQPASLGDGEFVVPARIVSEIGNGSTDAGARKLYAMMDRVQRQRSKTVGKGKVAVDSKAHRMLPA